MFNKYVTDPIMGEIQLEDKLIVELINTKEFRRLTRIRHLGFTDFIFPTATHNRFSHSLGTYELARRMLEHLNLNLGLSTKRAVLAAALLHDVGHGPFSHNFELISNVPHEKYSALIIKSENTEINQVFKKIDPVALNETIEILEGKHKHKWANQIISSEIDVDRLDYLLRDSMFSGKNYGSIDWILLIKNTLIIKDELIFSWQSFPILESIILGRYHMNQVIYKNYLNSATSQLFLWYFNRLKYLSVKKELKFNYKDILKISDKVILNVEEFYLLDDVYFLFKIKESLQEEDKILKLIAQKILNQSPPEIITDEKEIKRLKKEANPEEEEQSWAIIDLELDFKFYQAKKSNEAKILSSDNKIVPFREFSTIITRKNGSKSTELKRKIGVKL